MSPKKKKEPEIYGTWFVDHEKDGPDIPREEFKAYVLKHYNVDITSLKVTMQMKGHIDAADWFMTTDEFEIAGHKFSRTSKIKRTGRNRENWRDRK